MLVLLERVNEAQRLAVRELREAQSEESNGRGRKNKRGAGDEGDEYVPDKSVRGKSHGGGGKRRS